MPSSLTSSNAFICCSAYNGHAATGTPHHTLSSVEFHPQCDTNPPTAGCDSTATCGAHPITFPTPAVRSLNPSGSTSLKSEYSLGEPILPLGWGRRKDHRNRCPLRSSAYAISLTWSPSKLPLLPKQRNTTDNFGWSSSQSKTASSARLSLLMSRMGPTMEHEAEKTGTRGEEHVRGKAKLVGHVYHAGAEHVDDEPSESG
ncbi:hypothetical protein RJ640_012110 [Escallonia rubra]|uniref:Uncharacterized protein n=1 Tax=Escallonia rubra TaxID=112253 RepID=A0AA88S2V7_9ASTE|nr:hypothetical protein RJ640_012110 [Escallonia rubra]